MRGFAPITAESAARLAPLGQTRCGFITEAAWSPDGALLALAHAGGVWLWRNGFGGVPALMLREHEGPVKGLRFHPTAPLLATASADTTVRLWDTHSGSTIRTFVGHGEGVSSADFNRDGTRLLTGSGDEIMRLFDVASGELIRTFAGHTNEIRRVRFAVHDTVAISGGWDRSARLWQVESGATIAVVEHEDWVRDLAVSPDGRLLATAGKDGVLALWDAESGKPIRRINAHEDGVDCVTFSPDGALIATGGRDHAIRLWEVERGTQAAVLTAHQRPVLTLAFHPDGRLLASGAGDNQLRLWGAAQA
jgi:WD40 repeat protein